MFAVRFVEEGALPAQHTWVIGVDQEGRRYLFVKEGAVLPTVLEEAWRADCMLRHEAPVAV